MWATQIHVHVVQSLSACVVISTTMGILHHLMGKTKGIDKPLARWWQVLRHRRGHGELGLLDPCFQLVSFLLLVCVHASVTSDSLLHIQLPNTHIDEDPDLTMKIHNFDESANDVFCKSYWHVHSQWVCRSKLSLWGCFYRSHFFIFLNPLSFNEMKLWTWNEYILSLLLGPSPGLAIISSHI